MRHCPGDTIRVLWRRPVSERNQSSTLHHPTKAADQALGVAEILRRAILSRGFVSGEHLIPERIATELGVSRALVIAALRQLDREGLVTIGNNGRPYVGGPTPRSVADHRFPRCAWEAGSDIAYANLTVTDRQSQALPFIARIHQEILLSTHAADTPRELAALYRHNQVGKDVLIDCGPEPPHAHLQSVAVRGA